MDQVSQEELERTIDESHDVQTIRSASRELARRARLAVEMARDVVDQAREAVLAIAARGVYRYGPGGVLKPHQDGTKFHSLYSVLVYLNDDFSGGRTDFERNPTRMPSCPPSSP